MEGGGILEIGEMPEGWKALKLEDVGVLQYGFTASAKNDNTGIKLLRITDITDIGIDWPNVPYCDLKDSEFKKYELSKGDVLFARIGSTTGKTCYIDRHVKGVFASYLIRFRPLADDIETNFLYFYTQSRLYWSQINKNKEAHLKKGINAKVLGNLLMPLPPLPEQRRIAEVLGTVDSAIQKVGGAIESTERLKKGLMQRLLMRGIGHERFKESEVGRVPEEWEVVRLGDVADDFVGGGTPSTTNPDYWNGKIAWMTSSHINGRIVNSGQRLITEKGLKESSTHLIPKDNLLVATRVGIGKAAINSIDVAISQDLTGVIIKKDKVNADYIYWVLLANLNKLKSLAQGSTIKGILKDDLANLKIPLPPLPEQRRIAEILSAVDRKLELERRRKEKLSRVKKGLMNELLTGRKRLKVENDGNIY
ncbi:MAG TPA: restriction endonuclease subunit S [Candidatus Methanoperedens sp.]|nr:restriction endonuclease subunit S [Candidatus Methanoperedens sp.]HLB69412.1 restriction endonuclease subunit S [Candidatus Methanoperedens sp.]